MSETSGRAAEWKVYGLASCDSCRKARKWLAERGIAHEFVAIREQPPGTEDLARGLDAAGGELRRLFNTSGADYRELGLKERLPGMAAEEAIALLAGRGNLIKRPFVVGRERVLIGFRPDEWESALGSPG